MIIVEGRCAIIITEIVYVSIIITRTHLEVEGATDQQSDSQPQATGTNTTHHSEFVKFDEHGWDALPPPK